MTTYYSASTSGFYFVEIHGENIPADCVEITDEEHAAMLEGQSQKRRIVADKDGKPILADRPVLDPAEVLAQAKTSGLSRLSDYAKAKRALIAGTSDDGEIAGWSNKLRIAQAIGSDAGTGGEIAAFQTEIDARGISGETLDVFCQKVIKNAAFFTQAVALIDGLKRKAQDAVNAATDADEVAAVLAAMKQQAEAAFVGLMQSAS